MHISGPLPQVMEVESHVAASGRLPDQRNAKRPADAGGRPKILRKYRDDVYPHGNLPP
jgi:hypothetical protein